MEKLVTLFLKLPRNVEITPEATLTFLSSLSGINRKSLFRKNNQKIALQIILKGGQIHFQITTSPNLANFIESQLTSSYPTITIERIDSVEAYPGNPVKLVLKNGSYYPIKTYKEFRDVDPLASLLTLLSKEPSDSFAIVEFDLVSAGSSWSSGAIRYAERGVKKEDGSFIPRPDANIIKEKVAHTGFFVQTKIYSNKVSLTHEIVQAMKVFARAGSNEFVKTKRLSLNQSSVLNIEELATIWHLPSAKIKTTGINWGTEAISDPPHNLPVFQLGAENHSINFFAKTLFKNKLTTFGIKDADRRRHIWAIGKTGTGKSTLIANMAIDDIRKGKGLAVIDPHGDLCETLLNFVPKNRIQDVIYFNPSDRDFPIAINPLEVRDKNEAEFVVSSVIAIMSKIFGKFWGPRLEYVLRNALLTLTEVPGATLKDVPEILTNRNFRNKIVSRLQDKVLKSFWVNEYENLPPNLQKEVIFPILNKIGQFVTSPMIRSVIDKPKSSINLESIMNSGKIFIVNLSQGKIGEDNAKLLGAMLIAKLQLGAMTRVNVPESERKDFYLYVDEFQNFATDSFIKILSEARKYHLNLMLANQYIAQIPPEVQKAILGNAGTLISFTAGATDAKILSSEFAGVFKEETLINLANYQIAIRLMIDNVSTRAFLGTTLPLPKIVNGNKDKIIDSSRRNWGQKT